MSVVANQAASPRTNTSNAWQRISELRLPNVIPLAVLLSIGAAILRTALFRRWYAADAGTFSQSALRILRGALPHRDYIALYSEGLSYLHALAFSIFPASFSTERLVLFLCFLIWLPSVYVVARNYVQPWSAVLIGLLAVCWSVPQYPESMPSWYCMFCATFGVLALIRYAKTGSARWLVVAGIFAGLSFLVKVIALYFVAAVLLFFVYREQTRHAAPGSRASKRWSGYTWFVQLSLVAFLTALFLLIRPRMDGLHFIHFIVPSAALVLLVMFRQHHRSGWCYPAQFRNLFGMILPFSAGFAVTIAFGLYPYLRAHALGDFLRGVFVLPFRHVADAASLPPGYGSLLLSAGLLAAVACTGLLRGRWQRAVSLGMLAAFAAMLGIAIPAGAAAVVGWPLATGVTPALIVLGAALLFQQSRRAGGFPGDDLREQLLFLLLAACALCSLVQFPFYTEAYFCYVAPLTILALLGLQDVMSQRPRWLLGGLAIGFLVLGFALLDPGRVLVTSAARSNEIPVRKMNLARAGDLEVPSADAALYEQLAATINAHAGNGDVLAGPDCPEVSVLSEHPSPGRDIFEFLDEQQEYRREVARLLATGRVRVVVINHGATFSRTWIPILESAARSRYSHEQRIGNFEVRWN